MSGCVCVILRVSEQEGGENMLYLIICAVLETVEIVLLLRLIGSERCTNTSIEPPEPSNDGEFWQNIISYDHKMKGGDKD